MSISRATLPQEFFDITTPMLLRQPEPQYLHARLMLGAMSAQLDSDSSLGLPVPGRPFGDMGPNYANLDSQMLVISDPIYKDAITVVAESGKGNTGHTVRINRPKFTNSVYTRAVRAVPVGSTISVVPIDVQSEQALITIERFAGPYDATNSRVAPYGVERFDANRMIHNARTVTGLHLQRDFHRTLDSFGVSLFDDVVATAYSDANPTGGIIYPNGMTADNDSAVAGDFPMSYAVITKTALSLTDNHIPPFANNKYLMILRPRQTEQLKRDPEFQRMVRYTQDKNPVFVGSYVGTVDKFDILESTTLSVVANAAAPTPVNIQYGQAFGPGAVGLGMGANADEMPRVAFNTQDNYGETALVIWLAYLGLATLDSRFTRSIRTS